MFYQNIPKKVFIVLDSLWLWDNERVSLGAVKKRLLSLDLGGTFEKYVTF